MKIGGVFKGGGVVDAILNFEGNRIEIKEFKYNKKLADTGEPNNTSFVMRVESTAGFVGTARFICGIDGFRRFISELDDLFKKQIVSAKLVDQSLGSYILFKVSSREIFTVKGMLVCSDGEHILKYELSINRSEIFEFIKQLQNTVREYCEISAS